MDKIKEYARKLGADDRCDGFGKNGYYQVIDWLIEKFPDSKNLILDNGDDIYSEYSAAFN